jgi:predicted DNA-binding protein
MVQDTNISVSLPISIFNMVDAIASEKKVEKDEILNEALELYINEWKEYKIAAERLKDTSDDILTEEEFLNELKEDYNWEV